MTQPLKERLVAKQECPSIWYDGGYRHLVSINPDGPEALALLKLADSALACVTAFEDDARYIMGVTNFEIVRHARDQIRSALNEGG